MAQLFNAFFNGPSHYTQSHHLSNGPTLVIVLGALLAEFVGVYVLFMAMVKAVQYARPFTGILLRHFGVVKPDTSKVFLELTFPAGSGKSAFATEQLHILRISRSGYANLKARLAAHKHTHSLEVYATHDSGIRFVAVVPESEVSYAEHSLRAYLPGLKITQVPDYLSSIDTGNKVSVLELRLGTDYVLPLKEHKALEEHDFIAFLTGHMTKLAREELIAYQIVDVPVSRHTHNRITRHMRHMRQRIALGKTVSDQFVEQRSLGSFSIWAPLHAIMWFLGSMLKIVRGVYEILVSMFSKDHAMPDFLGFSKGKIASDNTYEQEVSDAIKAKLAQPLFEVSIRILVAAEDTQEIERRLTAILASFAPFKTTYQEVITHSSMFIFDRRDHQFDRFVARSISPHWPDQQTVLSASEMADLYHFPNTDLTKTEGLVKSRSQELPAPLSIKHSQAEFDVVVGVNRHGGERSPIGMTLEQRQKHTYVIGKTGTGKTTLLTSAIYQDMVSGKGVGVLDPHGDMFRELLEIVPEHRKKDVIVFNPADRAYPIGLNVLAPGIHFDNEEDAHDRITSSILSVFAKLSDEAFWGPRMEHVLRSTTLTALKLPNPSLYTIQRLLTEKRYQKYAGGMLTDPVLKQFWQRELAMYGDKQLASLAAPLTNRLGHFITSTMSRHILLQEKSTISISNIMDEGKILLVNLSKGDIGEDQSYFFGTLLTSLIWMAAYERTKQPEKQRRDFFLYIDEFQNFATPQFTDITSEGRKFHISLTASHQNIAQIKDASVLKTVAANVSSIISLKASPDDEAFILPFMEPEVSKGDIVNLSPYHFYMKTTSEESEDAFSGTTVPIDVERSVETSKAVIKYSQKHYGTPRKEVEEYLEGLFGARTKP
jgi:hypothetical protein